MVDAALLIALEQQLTELFDQLCKGYLDKTKEAAVSAMLALVSPPHKLPARVRQRHRLARLARAVMPQDTESPNPHGINDVFVDFVEVVPKSGWSTSPDSKWADLSRRLRIQCALACVDRGVDIPDQLLQQWFEPLDEYKHCDSSADVIKQLDRLRQGKGIARFRARHDFTEFQTEFMDFLQVISKELPKPWLQVEPLGALVERAATSTAAGPVPRSPGAQAGARNTAVDSASDNEEVDADSLRKTLAVKFFSSTLRQTALADFDGHKVDELMRTAGTLAARNKRKRGAAAVASGKFDDDSEGEGDSGQDGDVMQPSSRAVVARRRKAGPGAAKPAARLNDTDDIVQFSDDDDPTVQAAARQLQSASKKLKRQITSDPIDEINEEDIPALKFKRPRSKPTTPSKRLAWNDDDDEDSFFDDEGDSQIKHELKLLNLSKDGVMQDLSFLDKPRTGTFKSPPRELVPGYDKPIRKRRYWSDEEMDNLKAGVERFGHGQWAKILKEYEFGDRTSVDLKDKWRNYQKRLSKEG